MAGETVAKFWLATKAELKDVLLHEQLIQRFKPTKSTQIVHESLSELYCRYVHLCRMLDQCYDRTLQVQKRQVIKILTESANRRLLELQQKIKQMELSEFTYIDGALRELHLIPEDVQIVRPCYFPLDRAEEFQSLISVRNLNPVTSSSSSDEWSSSESEPDEPPPDPRRPFIRRDRAKEKRVAALNLILAHEKARRARILLLNFKIHPKLFYPKPRHDPILDFHYEFYHRPDQIMLIPVKRTVFTWDYQLKRKNVVDFPYYRPPGWIEEIPEEVNKKDAIERVEEDVTIEELIEEDNTEELIEQMLQNRAARKIQQYWKRYKEKKRLMRERYNKSLFLGMIDEMKSGPDLDQRIEQAKLDRRKRKLEFDESFIRAIEDEKARILQQRAPWIMEDISDHIRAWFRDFYDFAHAFDRYPEAWEGGTLLVIRGETLTPDEYMEAQRKIALEKKKTSEQKKKEAEAKKKAKEKEKEKKKEAKERLKELKREEKEREKEEGKTYDFKKPEFATNALLTLDETLARYEKDWYFVDELENKAELPIMEWITLDKFAEVHQELRPLVDEVLRGERELLQKALCKDTKKKYKQPKPKKQRKRKGKGKSKSKKQLVDLTADRTIDSLYDELAEMDIIRTYKKRNINDYIGDYNYAAFERRNFLEQDPPAAMGEVRDIIFSWLFGLGPLTLPKPKSFCLIGPSGYGKTMLVEAICSEMDAVLFDLSPSTVAPIPKAQFPMLIHIVLKLARILQPTVIHIDQAHKVFYKKIPPDEKSMEPTKLGQFLFKKLVKQVKKEEKILLVGTSNQPWTTKIKKFKKCFEKFLMIPRTDYGTAQLLWKHALNKKTSVSKDFDVSSLSLVTKGYSPKQIFDCVNQVLGIRRRMRLEREPVTSNELLNYFLQKQPPEYPITDKEYDKYLKFYRKSDKLAKKRAKLVKAREEALAKLKMRAAKK
ncbi:dynein regulatory complex protein 11 [Malaya genurostris]|uniref:dynein regulatory complex protein 11 n=1 Tax=Malaya genurostris TaxID=325434 RepID=UPI0026F39AD0|nr:dynein regulatory complex protein 11 [Malaya genurostris]XP_058459608.1 dynein regulatory complex protein 11 [Malaya genurostris]